MIEVPKDITEALRAVIQEECLPCYRPYLLARDMGQKVIERTINLADAEYMLLEDLLTNCAGSKRQNGCMKAGDCRYQTEKQTI